MKKFSRPLLLLLVFSFLLRIIIMLWSFNFRENTDILRYRDWARISYIYGFADTYKTDHLSFGTLPNNQPPGSLYSISLMYNTNIVASKAILKITHSKEGTLDWVNGPLFNFFLRLPSIASDILIGFLIYKIIIKEKNKKHAILGASLFLFNPIVLYNSSFWGQMDSLNNLFFYVSLFLLLKRKYFFSILFYGLSLYIKLSLLPLIPIFFVILFCFKKRIYQLLPPVISTIIIIIILTLPVSLNPWWLTNFFANNHLSEMRNITSFSFNFWWLIFKPFIEIGKPSDIFNFSQIQLIGSPLDRTKFMQTTLSSWGYFIFAILISPFIIKMFLQGKKLLSTANIFLIFSIAALLSFLFLPYMHERYLYPFFPLMATYVGLTYKKIWIYIPLAIMNFINLYIVWHPFMTPLAPYWLISNISFQWLLSLFIVILGFFFYIGSFKIFYERKNK